MSDFVSLNTALSALRAGQWGLDVTTDNIANANTLGHTRQRLDLRSRAPHESAAGWLGTGVTVDSINRLRDGFLDARVRSTSASSAELAQRAALLRGAEQLLGEPDGGITVELDALWSAFDDLANDPTSTAARQQVLTALDATTARFRTTSSGWEGLAADARVARDDRLGEANALLTRVAELNGRVRAGEVDNQLLDERDRAVDRLATLTGATPSVADDGTVTLRLGGTALVDGTTAGRLDADGDAVSATAADGAVVDVTDALGGEAGGLTDTLVTDLPGLHDQLGALAVELRDTLNAAHAAAYRRDGDATVPGGPLVAVDPAATPAEVAASLRRDPALTTATLATAGADPAQPHDGRGAAGLADLRTTASAAGSPLGEQARALAVGLATAVSQADGAAAAQAQVARLAEGARQSQHGVSLDEEMVAMVRYQRALEAASRIMTAVDQALDTLVNRTGLVGR